jgi:N-acetylglucosaminyldiphosphoundecaprenol N-acetyl-beta-D-mannosaminyltransferase
MSSVSDWPVVPVAGFSITSIPTDALMREVQRRMAAGEGGWVLTLNLEMVSRSVREPAYGSTIRSADLIVADGMPVVWACKRQNPELKEMDRTTGSDLTRQILPELKPNDVAILGGKDPRLALKKLGLDPDAGYFIYDGRVDLSDAWIDEVVERVGDRRIVFVALGVPKQDVLIERLRPKLPHAVLIGVGGSFEFIANITKRAPQWMQKSGLEWLFRLSTEPRRLWKRYLVECPPGAILLYRETKKPKGKR